MADQTQTYADKPWLKSYVSGPFKLPHSMGPYPTDRTAFQDLIDAAELNPNRTYLVFNGKEYTYGEMNEKSNKLANSLIEMGIKKGDRVGLICANSPQFLIADSAVLRCGGVIVPISVIHKGPEILYEAQTAGIETVFVHQIRYEEVMKIKEEAGIKNVIVIPVPQWPGYGDPDMSMIPDDAVIFDDLVEKGENVLPDVEIDPVNDLCILPFTGGTTGRPKATMCTHYAMVANTMQTLWWMLDAIQDRVKGKASAVVCIPMFHIYGYWLCHASASWSLRLLLSDPRDIDTMIDHIKKYRPFMIVGVPTHFNGLLNKKGIPRGNNMWFTAAAPMPIELAEAVEKANGGMPMAEGYGCSEMTGGTHLNICAVSKMTGFLKKMKRGIGLPVPDLECKILDLETGEEVPFGERGELWVRGPQSMLGYWPEKGSGLQKDGWLATGDVVIMDEDGY
ncbi:MAG: AMP-binding protein, partial [Actinobacteria bacterium]|nr:AMP-binding protein [Actinomycetota bacterium]